MEGKRYREPKSVKEWRYRKSEDCYEVGSNS